MLVFMLDRLRPLQHCELVVATTEDPRDDPVARVACDAGVAVTRGSEHDVLGRFAKALAEHPAEIVVRLTGDCPLVDPEVVRQAVDRLAESGADYCSNTLVRTFPDGLDVEVLRSGVLRAAAIQARGAAEREHVTPFVYRRPRQFRLLTLRNSEPLGDERWTVDTADDLTFVRSVVDQLGGRRDFSWWEVLEAVGRRARPAPDDLHLRPAFPADAPFVFAQRNEEEAVRFSGSGTPVSATEHQRWFESHIDDPATRMWIGEVDGDRVGQIRIDVDEAVGTVSLAVVPGHRGAGYGTQILRLLQKALRADFQVRFLVAQIHSENRSSQRAFEGAGFIPSDETRGQHFSTVRWERDPRE